jgi:glycine betaine/proline transport system permease protein
MKVIEPSAVSTDVTSDDGAAAQSPAVARSRSWAWVVAVVIALVVLQRVLSSTHAFPKNWDIGLAKPINRFQKWVALNRSTNFFIADVLSPIGHFMSWCYRRILAIAVSLPWFLLPALVFVIVARTGKWFGAAASAGGLLVTEFVGLHDRMMETLALSLLCLFVCIVVGGPIGIWAGTRPGSDRYLRPLVDVLQSLPVTLYLQPAVLFFGIGVPPAAIATVLFAVGPLVRIAALGIRDVPNASVEAGEMFGSSKRQLLWKIRVPQAKPALLTGINQTIMAALSMAVIAGFVGAGGLGVEIWQTLRLRSPGRGLLVGLGIVAIAIAFDRVTRALVAPTRVAVLNHRRFWPMFAAGAVVLYFVGRLTSTRGAPAKIKGTIADPIDRLVTWIRDHLGDQLQSFNDFVIRDLVIPVRNAFGSSIAWPVVIIAVVLLAWRVRGRWFALFTLAGLVIIGMLGLWEPAAETLAQTLFAVALSLVIAIPLGIYVGTRPRLEGALNPFLETLQTLPSVVYAIPFVMVFAVGYLPGLLSTALFAVPAGVRLAAMAVRKVDEQAIEAATTFGATSWQRLIGVRVPMAFDGIMLGVNQVIMMSMSMVLITGYFGSQGLGYLLVSGLTKPDTGVGLSAGIAVLIMSVVLDRLAEGVGRRFAPGRRA